VWEKAFNPLTSKSKHFYKLLISKKVRVSRGFTKWKENFCLDDTAVSKAFLMVRSISSETFIRSFQFKILNDITFTNHRLAKKGYAQNGLCTAELNQKLCITYFMSVLSQAKSGRFHFLLVSGFWQTSGPHFTRCVIR